MLISIILVLSIVFLIAVVVTGWDIASAVFIWQARIKIGRWNDRRQWLEALETKARKWLLRTPTVPVSDNTRYVLLDILKGRYHSGNLQAWQTAGLILGLEDDDAQRFVRSRHELFSGDNISVDKAFLAYALKKRGALHSEDENKVLSSFSKQLSVGTVPYSESLPDYRYVDTLGMICPFLYSVGLDELAERQLMEYDKALFDNTFPYHAYDIVSSLPLGAHDWGRGTGWYILALVESGRHEDRILKLAERMLPLQRPDGSFGSFLFDRYSPKDSSATVLAGILFVKAYEFCPNERFKDAAVKVQNALMKMTRRDGTIDFAQGDTKGVGMYSSRFQSMPFVQGMTLYFAKLGDQLL